MLAFDHYDYLQADDLQLDRNVELVIMSRFQASNVLVPGDRTETGLIQGSERLCDELLVFKSCKGSVFGRHKNASRLSYKKADFYRALNG